MEDQSPSLLKTLFEALLFVADEPLTPERLQRGLSEQWPENDIRQEFESFMEEWNNRGSGVIVVRVAGGYQFRTNPRVEQWVRKFKTKIKPVRLSRAALETLAIIAYKQPVSTPEIEAIRGVNTSGVIKTLLEKGLVTILGRKEVAGRPLAYGTTTRFLEEFGLNDIADLPTQKELDAFFQRSENRLSAGEPEVGSS